MNSRRNLHRLSLLMVGAGLIAGCAQPPGAGGPSAPAPARPSAPAAPATSSTGAPAAAEPAAPVASLSPQAIQKAVATAIELLEGGNEDQAAAELQRVLQSDPTHRLAQSLMRQIKEDPVAVLGKESFSYRVQPGESLSRIAGRFMNDVHQFYILARYNDIKVPRQLAGGQVIRVPGKAPPPVPAPAPAPAPAPVPAPAPKPPAPAPAPADAPATAASSAAQAAKARADAIARHTRNARSAFAKQDLNGAIRAWDSVLELDPENRTAQLERQKAVDLKEKLTKVK